MVEPSEKLVSMFGELLRLKYPDIHKFRLWSQSTVSERYERDARSLLKLLLPHLEDELNSEARQEETPLSELTHLPAEEFETIKKVREARDNAYQRGLVKDAD